MIIDMMKIYALYPKNPCKTTIKKPNIKQPKPIKTVFLFFYAGCLHFVKLSIPKIIIN